jgi:chromate transporter
MRSDGSPPPVSLFAAAKVWAKIGLVGFGGPAGQISLMHQELVERRRWIDEERFLHALNYCMLLPGPEAQQLATYIGWLLHRTAGGLVAGVLFVLPGAVAVLLLSILYASARELPAVAALLFGLKAAVLAVVIAAVLRIGRRALTSRLLLAVAAASFVALRFFAVPFPVVVLGAGLLGLLGRGGRSASATQLSTSGSMRAAMRALRRRSRGRARRPPTGTHRPRSSTRWRRAGSSRTPSPLRRERPACSRCARRCGPRR